MNIRDIIKTTYAASDTKEQKNAEDILYDQLMKDPTKIFVLLVEIVKDQNTQEYIRQQAGTIFSRYIHIKDKDGVEMWNTLNQNKANIIKDDLLQALSCKKQLARRSASNAISRLATLQFPKGTWDNLIPILLNASSNDDINFKKTAIMALGFLCIELKQFGIPLKGDVCKPIIGSVYLGITDSNNQLKREGLIALTSCTSFMDDVYDIQDVRHKVILSVLQCLQIPQLTQLALQFFIQYTKYHFKHLQQIIEHLFEKTLPIIQQIDERSVVAIQFWSTVANIQFENLQNRKSDLNILSPLADKLVDTFLLAMTVCQKDGENNLRQSAYRAMFPLAEVYSSICIKKAVDFSADCLNSPDWTKRQCATMVFATISSLSDSTINFHVENAIDRFFGLLNDENEFVVLSTLIGLAKILETQGGYILKKNNYEQYLNVIQEQFSKGEDIQLRSLEALAKMTECFQNPNFSCELTNNIITFASNLSGLLSSKPYLPPNTMQALGIALIHLLQGNRDKSMNRHFIQHLIEELDANRFQVQGEMNLKACHLVILHACLLSMKQYIDADMGNKIVKMLIQHFQNIQTIDVDGLYVIGALSIRTGENFLAYYDALQPYIDHALTLDNEPAITTVIIGVAGDISKAIGKARPDQVNKFLTFFENKFHNSTRQFKIVLILGLGDLIREITDVTVINNHINQLIGVVNICVEACLVLIHHHQDPEYTDDLREAIRDLFECMCSGPLRDNHHLVTNLLISATNFIIQTADKSANPSMNHYKKGFLLIFDIASSLVSSNVKSSIQRASEILSSKGFVDLFNEQRNFFYDDEIKGLQSYGRAVFGALRVPGISYI